MKLEIVTNQIEKQNQICLQMSKSYHLNTDHHLKQTGSKSRYRPIMTVRIPADLVQRDNSQKFYFQKKITHPLTKSLHTW